MNKELEQNFNFEPIIDDLLFWLAASACIVWASKRKKEKQEKKSKEKCAKVFFKFQVTLAKNERKTHLVVFSCGFESSRKSCAVRVSLHHQPRHHPPVTLLITVYLQQSSNQNSKPKFPKDNFSSQRSFLIISFVFTIIWNKNTGSHRATKWWQWLASFKILPKSVPNETQYLHR